MKHRGRLIVLIAVLVVVALGFGSPFFDPEPVEVTVFRAAQGVIEETVTNSKAGTVKTRRRASLSPEIGGRVAELAVRKGDTVKAGQLLLRLADSDFTARVRLEERSLEAARAGEAEACQRLSQATRELARATRLSDERIVSREMTERIESDRDLAASACEASRARVQQTAASLDFARAQLAKTVLRAPFGGVVAELRTELGEWITPSPTGIPMQPVLDLIDPSLVYVTAPLDEVDVARVRVSLPVRVSLDAFPGRSFLGRVRRVAPYVVDLEKQNRTFDIDVDLDEGPDVSRLPPGASADVEVMLESREAALRVPSHAVSEGGKVLLVIDGLIVERAVKTGIKGWEFTEITEGLSKGDAVVVSLERAEVKAGAKARIAGEALR
jgi:HlyD family secretion protein